MVKAADTIERDHIAAAIGPAFDRTSARCVLLQRIVCTVEMVVLNILTYEPPKVRFVQRNHVVQHFPARALDPSFGGSILPRRVDARPLCVAHHDL
jgi:hypothetical protein